MFVKLLREILVNRCPSQLPGRLLCCVRLKEGLLD